MELDTRGREAALRALTLIREDRTQRGKCCVSSSRTRSHNTPVRVRPFVATFRSRGNDEGLLMGAKRGCRRSFGQVSELLVPVCRKLPEEIGELEAGCFWETDSV